MKKAVISDVHGNLEALNAVLADIEAQGIDTIYCLGDTVGYGPFPVECHQILRERSPIRLMGNHEYAVLTGPRNFNPVAKEAIEWTIKQFEGTDIAEDIRTLKSAHLEHNTLYVHGSVENPVFAYLPEIDSNEKYRDMIKILDNDFKKFDICLVGHNHRPFLCTREGSLYPHDDLVKFNVSDQKLYISVGSVGQPRNSDRRSTYVVFDGETVEYRRVSYDVAKTAQAIVDRGLPEFLAKRLMAGK